MIADIEDCIKKFYIYNGNSEIEPDRHKSVGLGVHIVLSIYDYTLSKDYEVYFDSHFILSLLLQQ